MNFNQRGNLTLLLTAVLILVLGIAFIMIGRLAGFNLNILHDKKELPASTSEDSSSNAVTSTPTPVQDNSIKFDVEQAHVGDVIGTMKIVKLRGYKSDQATADSAFVDFSGTVTLRGEVTYAKTGGQMGEQVCIRNFDQASQAKLPKLTSQYYVELSFCFNNLELAKKLLVTDLNSEKQGFATVTINNYKIQWFPIEIYNTADLISATKD